MSNISNGTFAANKILRPSFFKVLFQNTIQATGLNLVTVNAVYDRFGSIACEVVCLALHRPNTCIEEEELKSD